MKATKIRSEIFGALFAPRRCLSMAQCDLMKKIQEKKKRRRFQRWHMHGSRKLEYSWIHGVGRLLQYKKSVPRKRHFSFFLPCPRALGSHCKKNTLLAWLFIAHRLSTFASFIVLFVSSLHDCIVSLVCRQRSCRFRTTTSALLPPIHPFFHVF